MSNVSQKEYILKIIAIFYPDAKVYLFGPRARGDCKDTSEIHIAIDNGNRLSFAQKSQLHNLIDALNIPQKTIIVDLQKASESLKNNILTEGILWKS